MRKLFVGILLFLLLDIPLVIFRGFVLSQLWLWFLVPVGVSPISVVNAIGISIVIGFFTYGFAKDPDLTDKTKEWWERAIFVMLYSTFATCLSWGIGWVVHNFM